MTDRSVQEPANHNPTPDLKRFFTPRSVALIGATESSARFGGRCLSRLIDFGYGGAIYPVNPKFSELRGLPCYPSLRDLPEAPDHVGIVVPAEHVMGMLKQCADVGASFATVYTGGFAESGSPEGLARQAEIGTFARRTGLRVMGPNCNGLINFRDAFAMTTTATIAGPRRPPGDIAVVSQSGGVGQVNVMWRAQMAGLGVSYEVSCGNSADLDVIDFLEFMIDDDLTRVILMVVEHIPSGARLARAAARAADREKPIIMLKMGRTEAGSRAAASHTGAMAGSDAIAEAALRQLGIIRVNDTSELCERAILLRGGRWPRGSRVATTSASGGNAVLLVDLGSGIGLSWPEYSSGTKSRLAEVLPKLGSSNNPTDVTNAAIGRQEIYEACIEAIANDENIDVVVPIFTMSGSGDLRAAANVAQRIDKPLALLWTGGCTNEPSLTARDLVAGNAAIFTDTMACVRSVRSLVDYGGFLDRRRNGARRQRPAGIDLSATRRAIAGATGTLTERASREVLAAYGLPRMREGLARNAAEASALAAEFGGPVALKIESPDIAHKTDAGGVRLGVEGAADVEAAFDEILASAGRYKPDAALNGVLVQEMAPDGLDLVVGVVRDPTFGPVIVVGAGGIYVEVMRDIAYRVAPVSRDDAWEMLHELRISRLFAGFRGEVPRDVEALCAAVERLSWLAHDLSDLFTEMDVNPLRVGAEGEGVWVLDALIVAGGAEVHP